MDPESESESDEEGEGGEEGKGGGVTPGIKQIQDDRFPGCD